MFAAALALAVVAAEPTKNFQEVFSTYDYPEAVLRKNRDGTVGYRLLISDKGVPTGCEIFHSTGWKELDIRTCAVLIVRARFKPALDTLGKPTAGTYIGRATWSIPGRKAKGAFGAPEFELTVTIAHGPKDIAFPAIASVAVAVDRNGAPSDCTPMAWSFSKDLQTALLVRDKLGEVACAELLQTFKFRPMSNEAGQPIVSIQTARVRFELAPSRSALLRTPR